MGYSDIDKKASTKYEPTKFMKKLAERWNVDAFKATSEDHLRRLVEEAKAKATKDDKANSEPLKGEIIPPTKNGHDRHGWGPQIAINVPIPQINVSAKVGPQWFDCVAHVKDAVLYMVLGATCYAVLAKFMGL